MKFSFRWAKRVGVSLWLAGMSVAVPPCYAGTVADVVYYGGMIYPLTENFSNPAALDPFRAHSVELVAVKDGKIVFAGEMEQAQRSGYLDPEHVGCFANLTGKTMLPGFVSSGARGPKVAADFAAAGVTSIELYDVVLPDILPRWQQAASVKDKGVWPRVILHPYAVGEQGARNRAFLGWPQQGGGQEPTLTSYATAATSFAQQKKADGATPKLLVTGADISNFYRAENLFPLASHQLFLGAWRLTLDEPSPILLSLGQSYSDSAQAKGRNKGRVESSVELAALVTFYHSNGQSLNIQAAGDRAVESAVTALERAVLASSVTDARHTISPASMAARHHVARLAGHYENLSNALALDEGTEKALEQRNWSHDQWHELGKKMAAQHNVLMYDMAAVAEWQSAEWSAMGRGASANLVPAGWSVAYGMPFVLQCFASRDVLEKGAPQNSAIPVSDAWTPLVQVQAAVLRLPREQTLPVSHAFVEPHAIPLSVMAKVEARPDGVESLVEVNGTGFDLSVTFHAPMPEGITVSDGTEGQDVEFWNYDQRINVLQALHAVTTIPIFRNHLEHMLGTIEAGKLADFVILDRNPLEIAFTDPLALEEIGIHSTIVAGKIVHGSLDCSTTPPRPVFSGDESFAVDIRAQ